MKLLCFKPTRKIHESGFRYIEYGYIDEKNQVEVVGMYDVLSSPYEQVVPFNLDITKSGWFRIMPRKELKLSWSYGGSIVIEENPTPPLTLREE